MDQDFFPDDPELVDEFAEYRTVRSKIVGVADVEAGYRPDYPVTVYQVSGDDTSGIAGLLMPDGTFRPVTSPVVATRYWEYDETLKYAPVLDENGERVPVTDALGNPCFEVKADSWTEGDVIWDGHAGHVTPRLNMIAEINLFAEHDGERLFVKSQKQAVVANRRMKDTNTLTGDWITTGELWKALERGTEMYAGRQPGVVHEIHEEAA